MAATLLQLRRRVLINLNDLVDEVNARGERYTRGNSVTAINQIINSSIHHYEQKLNSLYQGYLSVDLPINLVSNVQSYSLGANFRTPIFHVKRIIQDDEHELRPFNNYYAVKSTVAIPNQSYFPSYELEQSNIVFSYPPTDNETAGIIVKFPKKLPDLLTDISVLDDQLYDAEDCIVLKATLRALKTKDVSGALKNAEGWRDELREAEIAFYLQVGNRYVLPDKPQPVVYDDMYY